MADNTLRTVRVLVTGKVQGVWFRAWTRDQASIIGARGWVRNLPSGRVEAVAQGNSETIAKFLDLVHQGSPPSRVDRVDVENVPAAEEFSSFEVRY